MPANELQWQAAASLLMVIMTVDKPFNLLPACSWWCVDLTLTCCFDGACGIKTRKLHARIYRSMSRGHVEYGGYAIRPFIDSCQNVQTKGDVGHLSSLPVGGQTSCGQEFTSECQLINGLYAGQRQRPASLLATSHHLSGCVLCLHDPWW